MKTPGNIIKAVVKIFSSRTFLLWMIVGWIMYYVLTAVWMQESFANFAVGIEKKWTIRIPFIIFLVSGYLNLVRASIDVLKKGKLQFFMWLVLPLGILLFLTGFFVSLSARQFNWIIVGEGHTVKLPWNKESFTVTNIDPGLRESILDIDAAAGTGLFKYEPKVTIINNKSSKSFVAGAFPALKIGDAYFHILNFGLAPGIRLSEDRKVKEEGYMPLRILMPGSSDSFEIPPYPYKFLLSIEPVKIIQKGNVQASEYDLKEPLYSIRVFRGEKIIAERVSRNEIRFDGITVNFIKPTFWVMLEIVRDHAVRVIVSGMILTAIGIPLSLLRLLFGLFSKGDIAS